MTNLDQTGPHEPVPPQIPRRRGKGRRTLRLESPEHVQEILPVISPVVIIKRPAHRPKGVRQTPETKLRIKSDKAMRMRIYRMTHKLINAQEIVAVGSHKMIVITKDSAGFPHVETIRNEERMQKLLDEGKYGQDYLIVVGTMPDAKAADMLLNRAYGKAKESVTIDGEVKFSLKDLAARRIALRSVEEDNVIDVPVKPLGLSEGSNRDVPEAHKQS